MENAADVSCRIPNYAWKQFRRNAQHSHTTTAARTSREDGLCEDGHRPCSQASHMLTYISSPHVSVSPGTGWYGAGGPKQCPVHFPWMFFPPIAGPNHRHTQTLSDSSKTAAHTHTHTHRPETQRVFERTAVLGGTFKRATHA